MTENGVPVAIAGAPGWIGGSTATMAFDCRQPAGRVATAASERGLPAETCSPASGVVKLLPPLTVAGAGTAQAGITEAGLTSGGPASALTRRRVVAASRCRPGGLLSMREVRTEVHVPAASGRRGC